MRPEKMVNLLLAEGMDVEMPDSCGNHYAQILEAIQIGRASCRERV